MTDGVLIRRHGRLCEVSVGADVSLIRRAVDDGLVVRVPDERSGE